MINIGVLVRRFRNTFVSILLAMTGIYDFYANQVVFLTGGTGGLGGCLLYKLRFVLEVKKLYVLIRGPLSKALERWRHTLPIHFHEIQDRINSGQIILVPGDMTESNLGIDKKVLEELERSVTLIIHAAANISFRAPLAKVVRDNCLPALRLAEMSTKFTKLENFTQVSTAFANSFLPDGPIEEKVYYLANPDTAEAELDEIQHTGTTRYLQSFPWAYAYSKHLMERLMVARYPSLPLLLLRPSSIGPAIAQPYEMYGPKGSCPVSTLYSRLMRPTGGQSVWHTSAEYPDANNILDEIPVDLVANILMQHVYAGTRGVVHASSSSYIPKTLKWFLEQPYKHVPVKWAEKMATLIFDQAHEIQESREAQFYRIGSRAWDFRTAASQHLEKLEGPLAFGIDGHDIDSFAKCRVGLLFKEVVGEDLHGYEKILAKL
jgi:fatty acyl-CoA reductase